MPDVRRHEEPRRTRGHQGRLIARRRRAPETDAVVVMMIDESHEELPVANEPPSLAVALAFVGLRQRETEPPQPLERSRGQAAVLRRTFSAQVPHPKLWPTVPSSPSNRSRSRALARGPQSIGS